MKRASMKFTKGESGLYEKQEAEVSSLISKHEIKDLLEEVKTYGSGGKLLVVLWATWLFCGTVAYTVQLDCGWSKGFYMAVNTGYVMV